MKNEIKEILECMEEIADCTFTTDTFELNFVDTKILLDYITNLQEEIERQSKAQVILDDMLADYNYRIDRAVEYINENVSVYTFNNKELPHWEFDDDNINNLLNILQNGRN